MSNRKNQIILRYRARLHTTFCTKQTLFLILENINKNTIFNFGVFVPAAAQPVEKN
jgi:hypothetical protein